MRVGIIGSRNCINFDAKQIEEELPAHCTQIISGGAGGVDSVAKKLADEKQIPIKIIKPDYKRYGRRAPLVRNLQIVKNADMLLAFWDCASRGTAHTIAACIRENVPVKIIPIQSRG